MQVLIGTMVKTSCADYPFADREQAEAFVMSLRLREQQRAAAARSGQSAGRSAPTKTQR